MAFKFNGKNTITKSNGEKLKPQEFKLEMEHKFLTAKVESGLHFLCLQVSLTQLFLSFLTHQLFYTCLIFFLSSDLSPVCFSSFLNIMPDLEPDSTEWKEICASLILHS